VIEGRAGLRWHAHQVPVRVITAARQTGVVVYAVHLKSPRASVLLSGVVPVSWDTGWWMTVLPVASGVSHKRCLVPCTLSEDSNQLLSAS